MLKKGLPSEIQKKVLRKATLVNIWKFMGSQFLLSIYDLNETIDFVQGKSKNFH
jgi:hypothetical protein